MTTQPTRYAVVDRSDVGDEDVLSYTGTVRGHPRYSGQQNFDSTASSRAGRSVASSSALNVSGDEPPSVVIMDGRGRAVMKNGNVYEGECRLGMFEGSGTMLYANTGSFYDGQWVSHLPHGQGMLETRRRRRKPEESTEESKREDHNATDQFELVSTYFGSFREGEKDGQGEETIVGEGTFLGMFRNGKRHGIGRFRKSETGEIIDGVYLEDKLHGLCTVSFPGGDSYVGRYEHGLLHGKGTYTQLNTGDEFQEEFEHGKCICGVLQPLTTSDTTDASVNLGDKVGVPLVHCMVEYSSTNAIYDGGWIRTAEGSDRRGLRHGKGTMMFPVPREMLRPSANEEEKEEVEESNDLRKAAASGYDVYRGDFEQDNFEGEGSITYAATIPVTAKRRRHSMRRASQREKDDEDKDEEEEEEDDDFDAFGGDDDEENRNIPPRQRPFRNNTQGEERYIDGVAVLSFTGQFHRGLKHGRGELAMADGSVIEGFWKHGLRDGVFHRNITTKETVLIPPSSSPSSQQEDDDNLNPAKDGGDGEQTQRQDTEEGAKVKKEKFTATSLMVESAYFTGGGSCSSLAETTQ